MLYDPLKRARDQVKAYAPLREYLVEKYQSPGKHFVGIPYGRSDQDYPWVCYLLRSEQRAGSQRTQRLVITWGIIHGGFDPTDQEIFIGPQEVSAVGELIMDGLNSNLLLGTTGSYKLSPEIESLTDLNLRHPYYWGEMIIPLSVTQSVFRRGPA